MSTLDNASVDAHAGLHDPEELPIKLAEYSLRTSSGKPKPASQEACWAVVLSTDGQQIRRDVWVDGEEWDAAVQGWGPEGVIWPTWPTVPSDEAVLQGAALSDVHDYWDKTGNRLRDSAKWMATVLGTALAALVGTSPLTPFRQHHPLMSVALGLAGLVLLFATLFLILQVMRPQVVSFADVQGADARNWRSMSALGRWQKTVETHQDLYLPCGVKCLTSLRQSMIIEKMTLMALILAGEPAQEAGLLQKLRKAEKARAMRLAELRTTVAHIAMIGEYYKLRARSTRATYGGILCALLGTAAIIAAFTSIPT